VLVARLAPDAAIGLWRSLVARLVRDEEAAGSNPVSPTIAVVDDRAAEVAHVV
jgi:hypothetical protein